MCRDACIIHQIRRQIQLMSVRSKAGFIQDMLRCADSQGATNATKAVMAKAASLAALSMNPMHLKPKGSHSTRKTIGSISKSMLQKVTGPRPSVVSAWSKIDDGHQPPESPQMQNAQRARTRRAHIPSESLSAAILSGFLLAFGVSMSGTCQQQHWPIIHAAATSTSLSRHRQVVITAAYMSHKRKQSSPPSHDHPRMPGVPAPLPDP